MLRADAPTESWLDRLASPTRSAILAEGALCSVPAARELMVEGANGRDVFVILEGRARVVRDGRLVCRCGRGSFLGELSLLLCRPRSATVVAETPMRVLVLDPVAFEAVLKAPPVARELCRQLAIRLLATPETIDEPTHW